MMNKNVIFGSTSVDLVEINKIELSARLGKGVSIDSSDVIKCIDKYQECAHYRFAYTKIAYKSENSLCCFDKYSVYSPSLATVLQGSEEVIFLAVSAGIEVDKLINRSAIQSPKLSFYIDAIASAGIESYMDYISSKICEGLNVTKRFSPGYADFPLEFQAYLLNILSAKDSIGINLSNDLLMIPTKSITAVIGIT